MKNIFKAGGNLFRGAAYQSQPVAVIELSTIGEASFMPMPDESFTEDEVLQMRRFGLPLGGNHDAHTGCHHIPASGRHYVFACAWDPPYSRTRSRHR